MAGGWILVGGLIIAGGWTMAGDWGIAGWGGGGGISTRLDVRFGLDIIILQWDVGGKLRGRRGQVIGQGMVEVVDLMRLLELCCWILDWDTHWLESSSLSWYMRLCSRVPLADPKIASMGTPSTVHSSMGALGC